MSETASVAKVPTRTSYYTLPFVDASQRGEEFMLLLESNLGIDRQACVLQREVHSNLNPVNRNKQTIFWNLMALAS